MTDGSLIQAKSRRVARLAVVFGENSTLNDTAVCPDSTSSTTPEVMAIIEALNKMQAIGLKNALITSDSTSAINYIHDLFNAPATTRIQTALNNNSPSIKKSTKDIKDIIKNLNYVILIHTKGHQNNDFDAISRLQTVELKC